jgi:EAL domain-containing protein (putative c-di-GMP-specific phosphodiesterase class I)
MSKSLGLKVTAEGIETVDQLKYIQSLECDDLQGFLFSRPVEPDMIEKILKDNSYQDIITNFPSNITSFEI